MKIYLESYLAENFGDDLFIQILLERYPNQNFYAISDGFNNYNKKYKNLKVYSNHFLFRLLKKFKLEKLIANRCDLVLTLGGSMFIEHNPKDKDLEFTIGKNKAYILGTNFGPYTTKEYYESVKKAFTKAEDVCFREKYSYELFKDLPNVRYTSDIAFLKDTSKINNQSNKKVIISVIDCAKKLNESIKDKYENKIIEMINFFDKKGYGIKLASLCKYEGDEDAVNSIINKCDKNVLEKLEKYFYNGNISEAMQVFADSEIIVGTRFHANIVGALLGKKIIPICYSKKTTNVLNDMDFKGIVLDIDEIDKFDINNLNDLSKNKVENVESNIEKANLQFEKLDKVLK